MSGADPVFTPYTGGPPAPRPLAVDVVEVWALRLDVADETAAHLAAHLDAEERERARRFVFLRDRRRFEVSRGILRRLLSLYTGADPGTHRFIYGRHGKPRLAGERPVLHFNLAHADDLALFAFAHRPIGVDLEPVRPVPEMLTIAGTLFAPREHTTLLALPENERTDAFARCWTRKEAYVKALGTGLSLPLQSFTVSMRPGEPAGILSGHGWGEWALYHLVPADGFIGALAAPGRDHRCMGWLAEADALRLGVNNDA